MRAARDTENIIVQQELLWVSSMWQLNNYQIPACYHCGGHCVLGFQLMPQLLNSLHTKDLLTYLNWGTIAVYTCERSCDVEVGVREGFAEEFVWVQKLSSLMICQG